MKSEWTPTDLGRFFFKYLIIMNYRKIYEMETKTKVPVSFDIQHLDFNRENNNISNLVALPCDLHSKFHKTYNALYIPDKSDLIPKNSFQTGIVNICMQTITEYNIVYSEVISWITYRDYLMGILPNIYNKKY